MPKKIVMLLMLLLVFWGCEEKVLNFRIKYDQTHGLEAADRVIFQQNHIGQVAGIFYGEDGYYLVDVAIRKAFANAATEDSMFFITEDPKNKGKKAIEIIQARKGGVPLEDGAIVEGSGKPVCRLQSVGAELGGTG